MIFFLFVTFWKKCFQRRFTILQGQHRVSLTQQSFALHSRPCEITFLLYIDYFFIISPCPYIRIYAYLLTTRYKKIAKRFVRNLLIYLVCSSSESFNQGLTPSITHTASRHCKFQCLLFGNRERFNLHTRTPSGNELYIYIITCSFYIWRRNVNNFNLWKDPSVCTRRSDRKFKQIDTAGAADVHAQCLILRKIYFRPLYQSQP